MVCWRRSRRRATNVMSEVREPSYRKKLPPRKLPKLMKRRKRGNMMTTHKFLKGVDDVDTEHLASKILYQVDEKL